MCPTQHGDKREKECYVHGRLDTDSKERARVVGTHSIYFIFKGAITFYTSARFGAAIKSKQLTLYSLDSTLIQKGALASALPCVSARFGSASGGQTPLPLTYPESVRLPVS